jgi:gas vesicle protein
MGQEPDRIRAEIEQTRAEMSETVDALGYKADVKTRAKEKIVGVKDKVAGATPDGGEVSQRARRASSVAQQNPLGLAIGAVAIGFVAGMLIPSTRVEDEKLGEASDSVVEKVKETGSEALEHGKQVAQDAAQTAKESGQEHAQQVKETVQDSGSSSSGQPEYTTR